MAYRKREGLLAWAEKNKKIIISVSLPCVLFLLPFLYGYTLGQSTYESLQLYQNKILDEEKQEELQKSLEVVKELDRITVERILNVVETRRAYDESVPSVAYHVFLSNIKRIVTAVVTLGISFIPIMFKTGMWFGYYTAMDASWWFLFSIEFISYVVFAATTYYLLLTLLSFKCIDWRKPLLRIVIGYVSAAALLYAAGYYETILIFEILERV